MIVCYLIMTHESPDRLARLVGALPRESPVVIHVDARTAESTYAAMRLAVRGRPRTYFAPREACWWAHASIVRATLKLIDAALASGEAFDYATLLSGSDYPIKSASEIAAHLEAGRGGEFIESFRMLDPNRWSEMPGKFKAPERVTRLHLRYGRKAVRTPVPRALPYGLVPFGGGQWWSLTRSALEHVRGFCRARPRFVSFLNGVYIPDEFAIQTILANSAFAERITGDDLRLVVWDRPEPPYPATLRSSDIAMMRRSGKLFARKFDERVDAAVFDLIDRELRREAPTERRSLCPAL